MGTHKPDVFLFKQDVFYLNKNKLIIESIKGGRGRVHTQEPMSQHTARSLSHPQGREKGGLSYLPQSTLSLQHNWKKPETRAVDNPGSDFNVYKIQSDEKSLLLPEDFGRSAL